MLKTNTNQKGFTIVELLIVIVVIGILAMLVLNTFNGIQQKARDTERQTGATSVAKQLEAYFAEKGGYPQWSQMGTTVASATGLLKGTADNAYSAPGRSSFDWANSAAGSKDAYGYQPYSTAKGVTPKVACATNDACQSFDVTYWSEATNAVKTITSLN